MTTSKSSELVEAADIEGVVLSTPSIHEDERGSFSEVMRGSMYGSVFPQSNLSISRPDVLRGLHFHRKQADLWLLLEGSAQVGLVDLRTPRSLRSASVVLDSGEPQTLFIPPGVAHGYLALTECRLLYWVTEEYDVSDEWGLAWNDPSAAVPWENEDPVLSLRDQENPLLDWASIPRFEQ